MVQKKWVNLKSQTTQELILKDSADEIIKKIKKAKSDSEPIPDNLKSFRKKTRGTKFTKYLFRNI